VATSHIDELILKATIKADATERIAFHRSLRQDKSFRPTAGYILKNFVLAWLSAHPLSTPIPCTAAMASAPRLEIPVCPKDRSIPFTDLGSMRDMNTPPTPFCLLTVSQTCAASAVDAIVCSDEAIITVQVTISRRHGATPSSFEQIRAQLPVLFGEARRWCHVFVTGNEEDAEALRYDLREDLPADLNVTIYTAVLDLGWLGPIRERLYEMIEERVSTR